MIVINTMSMSREENHSRIGVYTHLTILVHLYSQYPLWYTFYHMLVRILGSPLKHKCNASKGLLRVVVVDRPNDGMRMKMKRIDVMHV